MLISRTGRSSSPGFAGASRPSVSKNPRSATEFVQTRRLCFGPHDLHLRCQRAPRGSVLSISSGPPVPLVAAPSHQRWRQQRPPMQDTCACDASSLSSDCWQCSNGGHAGACSGRSYAGGERRPEQCTTGGACATALGASLTCWQTRSSSATETPREMSAG